MLDTVKVRSPYLSEVTARRIERALDTRRGVHNDTGEVFYELTAGDLAGDFDHRVSLRVRREEWVTSRVPRSPAAGRWVGASRSVLRPSQPYVELEGSVHKALLGHNVHGGPDALLAACAWLLDDIGRRLGVELPEAALWLARRVDWAECYRLPAAAIPVYLRGLMCAEFPRRKVRRDDYEGLTAGGFSTAVKLYHKGPEFDKRDLRRLRDHLPEDDLFALRGLAAVTLRAEVGIKARKLDADFDGLPRVGLVRDDYLTQLHDLEVERLVRDGSSQLRTVRTHAEVKARLHEVYPRRLANTLFGSWLQLAALGEDAVKRDSAARTFYRHRKLLLDAAVSWHGADVGVVDGGSIVPADFAPVRRDPRRVTGEDPEVSRKLLPYRAA